MSDPLDTAPDMVPFATGAELEARSGHRWDVGGVHVLSKTEELSLQGKALHATIAGKGSIARLRERRRLERLKR